MSAPAEPIYLTPRELAERWRLSRATIYNLIALIAGGKLTYYLLGGALRLRLEDVERYEVWQRFTGTWTTSGFHVRHNCKSCHWWSLSQHSVASRHAAPRRLT